LDIQSNAAGGALRPSVWFGSLDIPDFQQEPEHRFLLGLEEIGQGHCRRNRGVGQLGIRLSILVPVAKG
jgi:hypothetical protein